MRTLHAIPFLITLAFLSCLLPAPSVKESKRVVEFGQSVPTGDVKLRLEAGLRQLASTPDGATHSPGDTVASRAGRTGSLLLGTVLLSRAVGADRTQADKRYKQTAELLNSPGYYDSLASGMADEAQIAGHGVLIRALCEYYLWTGDSGALDLAEQICNSLILPLLESAGPYPLDSAGRAAADTAGGSGWILDRNEPGSLFRAAEGAAQLYGLRKSESGRKVSEELVSVYTEAIDNPAGFWSAAYLSGAGALLRYDQANGSQDHTGDAENAWEKFRTESLDEFYGAAPVMGLSDGWACPEASSEAYILAMRLWALTGKGDYLEDAERIFYNGLLSLQTPAGGFDAITADTTGRLYRCAGDSCLCNTTWVEALARAVRFSYFVRDNKVLIPFYCAGELTIEQKGLHLVQTTDYPLGRTVRLEITQVPKRGIGLQIHFPSYMTMKSMTVNGSRTVSGTVNTVGLLEFRDIFRQGDIIHINFSFSTRWVSADDDSPRMKEMFKGMHGPLILGYGSDRELWLEKGVALRDGGDYDFILDDELSYRRDTVSGLVDVLTVMSGADVTGTENYDPPLFKPIYTPYLSPARDNFPEYIMVRIGKDGAD